MHSADDLSMCVGDLNGHFGRHIDGFDWVHGGFGIGRKNFELRILSGECVSVCVCVCQYVSVCESMCVKYMV